MIWLAWLHGSSHHHSSGSFYPIKLGNCYGKMLGNLSIDIWGHAEPSHSAGKMSILGYPRWTFHQISGKKLHMA